MPLLATGIDALSRHNGFAIALTGMTIVFTALVLISLALTALPKVLRVLNDYFPEKVKPTASAKKKSRVGEHEIAAAAAFAMHLHRKQPD